MNEWKSSPTWEAAARKYGPAALLQDLDKAATHEAKDVILDALALAVRATAMTYARNYPNEVQNPGPLPHNADECPLYQAIQETGAQMEMFDATVVQFLRGFVGRWGAPLTCKEVALRDQNIQIHRHRAFLKKNKDPGIDAHLKNASSNVVKESSAEDDILKWNNLESVGIQDLELFHPSLGRKLEGTLITDTFTPMVGTTTLLEDRNGDVILIALYNFLPQGVTGTAAEAMAFEKIPRGSHVQIAEPFLKIFNSGQRGIRIDNPQDLRVLTTPSNQTSFTFDPFLAEQKKKGNELFSKGLYQAAMETYLVGLRQDSFTATLLSNRAQASCHLDQYELALVDAAASLTIRPFDKKTWSRYRKALSQVEGEGEALLNNIISKMLQEQPPPVSGSSVDDLKESGNQAFGKKDYTLACQYYSQALGQRQLSRAMLSNWALCSLHMNALHDAMAASLASLRLAWDAKAAYRLAKSTLLLGAPDCAIQLVDHNDKSNPSRDTRELGETAHLFKARDAFSNPATAFAVPHEIIPNWYSPSIETFSAGTEGRGVWATKNLQAGQCILVERPIASCESPADKVVLPVTKTQTDDASQSAIKSAIVQRAQRDAVLSRVVSHLSDGAQEMVVVPFEDLLLNLNMIHPSLFLLPGHFDYYIESPELEPPQPISADRVGRIVINSDGSQEDQLSMGKATELFPGVSMFNHSEEPNCSWTGSRDRCLVMTINDVQEGEELTISYQPDDEQAKLNWEF